MSYEGSQAIIPLAQIGLLTDQPPGEIPRGALIRATNISYETGMISKAPGSLRYNRVALPSGIIALIDWFPDPATQLLFAATADGKIYKDIGDRLFSLNVPINDDLGVLTPRCMFVEGGNETAGRGKKLFFFTGTAQLMAFANGESEFTSVGNPAADWTTPNYPTAGVIHRNRLWAFMGQRAYASDTADHENFVTNALTQNIFPGEGGNIVGVFVFKGRLFAFKDGGFVYYLDESDADSDNWVWRKLASNFGLSSPHGIIQVLDDMIAINESGSPISYNAVNALGDIEAGDILRLMQIENYYRSVTSLNGLSVAHAIYYEAKKQAFFTTRTGHNTKNNALLHIDFNKQNPRPAIWTKDQADCLAFRKDINKIQRPIYGSSDGYVYLMDREDRLVGGSAYKGEFKIAHTDFRFMDERFAHKNKLFDYLALEFLPTGNWSLSVDVFIDGNFSETILFAQDIRDDGLDSFTLNGSGGAQTDPEGGDGDPLGREETQTVIKPLHGSGKKISLQCRNSGSNENFTVASFTIGFRPSGEQETRV